MIYKFLNKSFLNIWYSRNIIFRIISILLLRLRLLIVFIILWIVDILAYIKSSLPNNIFEHSIIKFLYSLSSELYSDLMYKIIN